jgi:hypothetical protein
MPGAIAVGAADSGQRFWDLVEPIKAVGYSVWSATFAEAA